MSSFEIGASRPVGAVEPKTTLQPASQNPVPVAASTDATAVETSLTTGAGTVPVDQSRVAEIRQAVANGTYPVGPATITDAMIAAGALLQKGKSK